MQKQRIETGQGRVEFIRHSSRIFDLIKQGYTIRQIHRKLQSDGIITLSYSTLCGLISKKSREEQT